MSEVTVHPAIIYLGLLAMGYAIGRSIELLIKNWKGKRE